VSSAENVRQRPRFASLDIVGCLSTATERYLARRNSPRVHEDEPVASGETVALTVLKVGTGRRAVLEREVEAARALRDDPVIVPLVGLVRDGGETAALHRHVSGLSLWTVIQHLEQRDEELTDGAVLHVAADLSAALARAHKAGVVHGQLSLGEVVIGWDGSVHLTGIGIRHGLPARTARAAWLQASVPPEGAGAEGAASDVFALGAVLWSLLARRPFMASDRQERLPRLRPELPAFVTFPIERALDPEPARRIHARALANAFERAEARADRADLCWTMETFRGTVAEEVTDLAPLSYEFDTPTRPFELSDVTPQLVTRAPLETLTLVADEDDDEAAATLPDETRLSLDPDHHRFSAVRETAPRPANEATPPVPGWSGPPPVLLPSEQAAALIRSLQPPPPPSPTKWVAAIVGCSLGAFFLGLMVAGGTGMQVSFGERAAAGPPPAPPAQPAPAKAAPEVESVPQLAPPPAAAPEAGSHAETRAEPPAEPSADAPRSDVDPSRVGYAEGVLVVTSPRQDATVYVNGAPVGKVGEALRVACGLKFLRLGTQPPPQWLGRGRPTKIGCRELTRVQILPY
jgi:serine/threonine protein kinase